MNNVDELQTLDPRKPGQVTKPDILTPHKISVVLLVQQYMKAKHSAAEIGLLLPPQPRRRFCMLLVKLIQHPDISYKDLYNMLTSNKYKIDPIHLEGFVNCMSELNTKGIEYLFDFFEKQLMSEKVLDEEGISQLGVFGLYIRRIQVTMDRMSFQDMIALYKNTSEYYERGVRLLAIGPRKGGILSARSDDTINTTIDLDDEEEERILENKRDRNTQSKWSIKQADLFISQQMNLLESNEPRALSPIDLQEKLNEIIQDNPLLSQAYFLTYMNNLRLRDYFGCVDALHRSFDRSPIPMPNGGEPRGFQFFSLNQTVMHANFGHREEALASLKECIMLAQEGADKRCLDLANSWYCILNSNKIDPFEKCLPEMQDLSMVQALSLSIQFVVKIGAHCNYMPTDLFELLQRSDEINCRNSLLEYFSDSLALRAALWTLYGRNQLSSLYCQLLLKLRKTWVYGDVGNSESVCMVLCSLSMWLALQGEFANCIVVLQHTKQRFSRNPLSNNWMTAEALISIQRSIMQCQWQDAIHACDQLYVIDELASILQRANVYIARGNNAKGQEMLEELLGKDKIDNLTKARAYVLLAYSMITPERMSSDIIDTLNQGYVIAAQSYLIYEVAIIDLVFAQVLLRMGMPYKALNSIRNAMETILANGGIYDRSKATFVFLECLIATAQTPEEKLQRIKDCSEMAEEAIENFKKLEAHAKVLQAYTFMATTYNDINRLDERNMFACKFRQYHTEFKIPVEYLSVAL